MDNIKEAPINYLEQNNLKYIECENKISHKIGIEIKSA